MPTTDLQGTSLEIVNQLVAFGYLPYLQQDSIATKQASSKRRRVIVMFFCMCFSSLFNAISVISVVGYTAIDVFGHLGWCIVLSDCGIISVKDRFAIDWRRCSDLRRTKHRSLAGPFSVSMGPQDCSSILLWQSFTLSGATCTEHLDHLRLKSFLQELWLYGGTGWIQHAKRDKFRREIERTHIEEIELSNTHTHMSYAARLCIGRRVASWQLLL